MVEKTVKIIDPIGLHARPASVITMEAQKHSAEITLSFNGNEVDMKSIMSIMGLGVQTESEITVKVNGDDEENVLNILIETMKSNELI